MSAIFFSPMIGPVPIGVILREQHQSSLGITEQPIETGAKITDHAYVEPKRLDIDFADLDAAGTWNALVRFQESREPFTIVSGLYVYTNMLIRDLTADREPGTARILSGRANLQEAIIVSTARTGDSSEGRRNGKPGGEKSTRSANPSKERAAGSVTKDRAAGTVTRGDQAASTVDAGRNQSVGSRAMNYLLGK